ncbi:Methyl-accepting chemotaxis protein McpB [Sporomusa acidovorans DSM 3132]|uniref:Methyl-accepting chemotaxis protein McpB n=1 Tax=Sporomusa acidovorans (strain ATCC 49682 / DSM 3132 / Mol) TaxID=1123286 RepID=A0ABZ3J945_SPOA4|nr:methyl-accepting chemotaxis protein McpB [Sporomusa acidovorans DSM 3132]SDE05609.1 methyl-accepting chemotaxis protein [Sporomusa acidovorans]
MVGAYPEGIVIKNLFGINRSSIRVRLLILILLLMFVSLGTMSGLSYYFSKQMLIASVNETATTLSTDYTKRVQASINELVVFMSEISSNPYIRQGTDRQRIVGAMAEAQKRIGKFNGFNFIFMDGNSVRFNGESVYLGDRDYFQQVVKNQAIVISNPLVLKASGQLSIVIAVPVLNNGNMTGVLVGTVSLANLSNIVQDLKFKDSGYGMIADYSGMVIANAKQPELVGKLNLREKKVKPEWNFGVSELDDRQLALFKEASDNKKVVHGIYNFDSSIPYIGFFAPIELPGGQTWTMIVSAPEKEVNHEVRTLEFILWGITVVCLLLGVAAVILISAKIAGPITKIRDEALALAEGDLRNRKLNMHSQDEIGQLSRTFEDMADKWRNLIGKVQVKAEVVAASSEQLTANAQQSTAASSHVADSMASITKGSDQQVEAVAGMTSAVEVMSANIQQIAATSKEISEIAVNANQSSQDGRKATNMTIEQMQAIREETEIVQETIGELAQGSLEIGQIVTLISSIAGQTNLLALNAAIEAARAGTVGKGFAVVAEEVRKLAEDSNQAAQKITDLIQQNEIGMQKAIAATKASSDSVKTGVDVAKSAGDMFNVIVDAIENLSLQVREITESIDQMAEKSQKLVLSVHSINKVSEETAAAAKSVTAVTRDQLISMEEISAASQGLAQAAEELQTVVAQFKV